MLRLTLPWIWRHPLARRRRWIAYGRYARWQAHSRFNGQPLAVPWVNRSRLWLRAGMTGASGNWYAGLHEWPDMAFVLHLLRCHDTFLDGGSNVGSYSVLAGAVIGARVIAVEPSPASRIGLRANLELNGIEARCSVLEACLGAAPGLVHFSLDRGPMNAVVPASYPGTSQALPVQRLDDLPEAAQSCCWKLDVEGFENEVLQGAANCLAQSQLRAVLLEDRSTAVVQTMERAGFRSCAYDPWSRRLTPECSSPGGNQIWIRDLSWAEERVRTAPPFRVLGMEI